MTEIVKALKGGSLSRTLVVREGSSLVVRKFISCTDNREYGLVRWQSQLRKLQLIHSYMPENCVEVIRTGVENDFYYYDIPFYEHYSNCYSALVDNECSPQILSDLVIDLLSSLSSICFGTLKGSISVYTNEEVLGPLYQASRMIDYGDLQIHDSELQYFKHKVASIIPKVNEIVKNLNNISCRESLTHGNLTLENILWDKSNKKLIMIDPYSETYCESIIGDVSQVLQSSQSGYEYLSQLLSSSSFNIIDPPNHPLPNSLNLFTEIFSKNLEKQSWFSAQYLLLFRASQFTRMFPFKLASEPRLGMMFMLHGISLLDQIKC